MDSMGDKDSFVWITDPFFNDAPELNKKLKDLEESSLNCHICRQFYCNAVSLRDCHHSFCSECIRVSLSHEKRSMKRIGTCPICRKEVKEDSDYIMPNWALQDAVHKFQNLRSLLHSSLAKLHNLQQEKGAVEKVEKVVGSVEALESSQVNDTLENSNLRKVVLGRRCRKRKLIETELNDGQESNGEYSDDDCLDAEYVEEEEGSKAGTSVGRSKLVQHNMARSEESSVCETVSQNFKNTCNTNICEPLSAASLRRIQPRTIPVYHVMKKSKLQDLCKIEGISSKGSDHELKQRHLEFLRLWNAECDAKHPRSKDQLVREIAKRENAKKAEVKISMLSGIQSHKKYIERIKESRKALGAKEDSSKKVSSGNASFDNTMKMGFKNLIQSYSSRKPMAKNKVGKDAVEEDGMTCQSGVPQGSDKTLLSSYLPTGKLPQQPLQYLKNSGSVNPSPTTVVVRDLPQNGVATRSRSGLSKCVTNKVLNISSTPCSLSNSNSSVKPSASFSKNHTAPELSRKKWICNHCTFVNEDIPWSNTKAKCGMCQMSRNLATNGEMNVTDEGEVAVTVIGEVISLIEDI